MLHRLHCSLTVFTFCLFLFLQPVTNLAQRTTSGRQPTAGRRNKDTSQRARAVAEAKVKSPGNAPLAPPPLGTPMLVKDIFSGFFSSSPYNLTNVNNTLFFTAYDGANGQELWKSDGTETGTVLVKDIYTGEGNSSYPYNLTNVNGTLYFIANDGTNGYELWKSDGTEAGTVLVKDIYELL